MSTIGSGLSEIKALLSQAINAYPAIFFFPFNADTFPAQLFGCHCCSARPSKRVEDCLGDWIFTKLNTPFHQLEWFLSWVIFGFLAFVLIRVYPWHPKYLCWY
jgi:hypothetical protein